MTHPIRKLIKFGEIHRRRCGRGESIVNAVMQEPLRIWTVAAEGVSVLVPRTLMDYSHGALVVSRHYVPHRLASTPSWSIAGRWPYVIDVPKEFAILKPLEVSPFVEEALNFEGSDVQ